MPEAFEQRRPVDEEERSQYFSSLYADARRWVHQERGPVDIDKEVMFLLNFKPNDSRSLADMGCGSGGFIRNLVEADQGLAGPVVGFNDHEEAFFVTQDALKSHPNVTFIESDVRDLRLPSGEPVPDNSFDIVTAKFILYHMQNPEQAISEFYRVLKPGGTLLIATRELDHQYMMWAYGPEIAKKLEAKLRDTIVTPDDLLGSIPERLHGIDLRPGHAGRYIKVIPPESWYSEFDFEVMHRLMQKFEEAGKFDRLDPHGVMDISEAKLCADDWDNYLQAAASIWTSYIMRVGRGKNARDYLFTRGKALSATIEEVLKSEFERQIQEDGYFTEYTRQGAFVWKKTDERKPKLKALAEHLAEHIGQTAVL